MLSASPSLAEKFRVSREKLKTFQTVGNKQGRALVTIPVVVHVVHDGDTIGGSENISDARIYSQMDALNRDFRNLNPLTSEVPAVFRSLAADFEIEFCLASRDPAGNPTNGVNRVNGGRVTWNRTLAEAFKPSTIWDRDSYLNIWTMRLGGTNANTLGYAQFPGMADSTDGIVIDYIAFGTIGNVDPDNNLGKTTTHEVAHWLGLFHVWGDDQGGCAIDDDVADTPRQASENFGCPVFPHVSCNNGPNGDMFMNYMDYTDDSCSAMFTVGQKEIADFTLASDRISILASKGCIPTTANERDIAITGLILPAGQMCTDIFVPVVQVRNHGGSIITSMLINYQIDGAGLNQYFWSGAIPSLEYDYIPLPEQTQSLGQHSMAVYLSSINGGFDQNPGNEDVSINYEILSTGTGDSIPSAEGFESGVLSTAWAVDNPNNDRTWEVVQNVGSRGTFFSARFDNFSGDATNNPRGKRDGLITPEYNLNSTNDPHLIFDVAYARKSASSRDSLVVYCSADCGFSWRRLYAKGGLSLATAVDSSGSFTPGQADWRTEQIHLGVWRDQSKVKFRFENYSDFGNNLYIDDVRIALAPVGIQIADNRDVDLNVIPNPSDGRIHIEIHVNGSHDLNIALFNSAGQLVSGYSSICSGLCSLQADLSDRPRGLYLVRINGRDFTAAKKILINR